MVHLSAKPSVGQVAIAPPTPTTTPSNNCLTFRAITDTDQPFLRQLYASTREAELACVEWTPEQKATFLDMQFQAQHTYYMAQFQQASFDIIEQGGVAIGRLYLDRRPDEIRIIDIALMPAHRNQGIGTQLLTNILTEGQVKKMPVRIHVEQFNPALRLYQRLGFQSVEEQGVYYLMEWLPQ